MKFLFMFILRVLFLPFSISLLGLTAAIEFMSAKPDWDFWKRHNEALIGTLPWVRYT